MTSRSSPVLTICLGLAIAMPLAAHDDETGSTPAQKARHHHFEELGDAFKVVRDQTKLPSPDLAAIKKSAVIVNAASIDQGKWFAKGTGPESGKTATLAEVWTKPEDFKAAQKLFADAAPKLLAAANAGDVSAIKASFGDVGKSCKNCHEGFRKPEEH